MSFLDPDLPDPPADSPSTFDADYASRRAAVDFGIPVSLA